MPLIHISVGRFVLDKHNCVTLVPIVCLSWVAVALDGWRVLVPSLFSKVTVAFLSCIQMKFYFSCWKTFQMGILILTLMDAFYHHRSGQIWCFCNKKNSLWGLCQKLSFTPIKLHLAQWFLLAVRKGGWCFCYSWWMITARRHVIGSERCLIYLRK